MPPEVSRMLTPVIVSEIWKSYWVTCRAQPPFWIRFAALLNDAQNCGMLFVDVAGGDTAAGNWSAIAGFCGPGSVKLAGFVALTAPVGGVFGLPKDWACALAAAATSEPPAVAARILRRDKLGTIALLCFSSREFGRGWSRPLCANCRQ